MSDKVFKKMKKFTGKGYSVTESLTAMRMKKLTEASNSFGFTNVRTQDEKIHLYFIIIYIQREKTHNFSGVLNIFCGKICFSSFLVNLQTNKPSLCWKDIGNKITFQGFCEYTFKPIGSTSLFEAHSSGWLLPGCGKCTGQERCVKICAKEIRRKK